MTSTSNGTARKSAYEIVRDRMASQTAALKTPDLCFALLTLEASGPLDEAGRIVRAVMEEALCERHPEADAASEAWALDPECSDPRSHAEVITDAAIAAYAKTA